MCLFYFRKDNRNEYFIWYYIFHYEYIHLKIICLINIHIFLLDFLGRINKLH